MRSVSILLIVGLTGLVEGGPAKEPWPAGVIQRTAPIALREGGTIRTLAFSGDGKQLAVGGEQQPLTLWDVDSGQQRTLDRHRPNSLVFLPDHKTLLRAAWWYDITPIDTQTEKELQPFNGPEGGCTGLACSPDGKLAASTGDDRLVRIWDIAEGRELHQLKGHLAYTSAVAFAPDNKTVASGSLDQTLRLWDAQTGKGLHQLAGHEDLIACMVFAPDGKTVASGSWDGTIRLWEVKSGKASRVFRGHQAEVIAAAFVPDGRTLISGSRDGSVRWWDIVTGKETRRLDVDKQGVLAMALTADGKTLATGDASNAIHLWDAATAKLRRTLRAGQPGTANKMLWCVNLAPDGKSFVTGGADGAIRHWDVGTGKQLRILGRHPEAVWGVAFSPDGQTVASVARRHGVARLWDVAQGKLVRTFKGPMGGTGRVQFARDGKRLLGAGGSFDSTLFLWDVASGRELQRFNGHTDYIDGVAFSPDEKWIATASRDGSLRLWDAAKGREVWQNLGMGVPMDSVVFSHDGKALFTGSKEGGRQWDPLNGTAGRWLPNLAGGAFLVTQPAVGKTIAFASADGTIHLLEQTTGLERLRFTDAGMVKGLSFSKDGRMLASVNGESVTIWDVTGLGPKNAQAAKDSSDKQLEIQWQALADQDAQAAFRAMWKLAAARGQFPPFFKARLRPVPVVADKLIGQLVRDLDADRFNVRERAAQELARLGEQAAPALHAALLQKPTLELHRRIDLLLAKLEGASQPAERLQALRALEVLENLNDPSARQVLEFVSKAPVDFRVKMEAKKALERVMRGQK